MFEKEAVLVWALLLPAAALRLAEDGAWCAATESMTSHISSTATTSSASEQSSQPIQITIAPPYTSPPASHTHHRQPPVQCTATLPCKALPVFCLPLLARIAQWSEIRITLLPCWQGLYHRTSGRRWPIAMPVLQRSSCAWGHGQALRAP